MGSADDVNSIVEYVNAEDAKRAKTELADTQFNGRAVFIREVCSVKLRCSFADGCQGPRTKRSLRCASYSG